MTTGLRNGVAGPGPASPDSTTVEAAEPLSANSVSDRRRPARKLRQAVLSFVLFFGLMSWIQFAGPAILDNDGYYHITWSRMLRRSLPRLPRFTWLPLTSLSPERFTDHHFLFHVALIPFTFLDPRIGAKIAAVVFSSIALTSVFWLLVAYEVRWRWLWLLPLAASSEAFLYRMSMTRAPSLSLLLLALGCWALLKKKHLALGILGFVFVWLYSLFPLLFAFGCLYSIAVYLSSRKVELWPPIASLGGIMAGLVLNPYFPRNIALLKEHIVMKAAASYPVDVGIEWYPYETWDLVRGSAAVLLIFFLALAAFEYRKRSEDLKPLFFLLVSTLLLILSLKYRRFLEYWPPFVILFGAFTIRVNPGGWRRWIPNLRRQIPVGLAIVALIGAGLIDCAINVRDVRREIAEETNPRAFQGAGQWLASNTAPGTIVFNANWDEFPMLFYYNSHNTYVAGLDPMYLYDRNPDLWKEYSDITLGNVDDPGPRIREKFGADYVVTDNEDSDFMSAIDDSGGFKEVYSDRYAAVFKVKSPGERQADGSKDGGTDDGDDDNR